MKLMKKLIYVLAAGLFAVSCSNPNATLVTFDDENTVAIRAHIQNYLENDVASMTERWSEDLVVKGSTLDGAVDLAVAQSAISLHHVLFSDISITAPDSDEDFYAETTTYKDSGETWTKIWFSWNGTGNFTGNTVSNMNMIGFRWADGKIAEEHHFSDGAAFAAEVAAFEASQSAAE